MLMTPDLLVCPACRQLIDGRLDVRMLERSGDVLACDCGRRYPVIDGVPVIVKDPAFLRDAITTLVERDLSPEVTGVLVEAGPDDATYPHLIEHLSVYLDAHWGDRSEPPLDHGLAPLLARIAALPKVAAAVELGCSVGRVLAELPAELAIGIDLGFASVRRARHLLAGESLAYARRMLGRHYVRATIAPIARPATLVCGDALDPPLLPGVYNRVVALNVLDAVANPRQLLAVIDGLCAPGGEIILSSPYTWQSAVVHDEARIEGPDPAATLVNILRDGTGLSGRYHLEDEAEIAWTLRRDARSAISYRTHYIRARKGT
jgi:uncharacterized protein YbaR (Trm112 family)/SAM-dependent methyltransferase